MIPEDFVIIIPARQASTRLPNKPLAYIGKYHLIEHVVLALKKSFKKQIYVATDSKEIAGIVEQHGVQALMTGECATGTDRVYEALNQIPNREKIKYVINLQGDMPFIKTEIIDDILARLRENKNDIVTAIAKVERATASSESNVKVAIDHHNNAMYFSRALIPHNGHEFNYHIGIYGFTCEALAKFVNLAQSEYEKTEHLEQLRALENGMRIGVCLTDQIPISVDTKADLENAIRYYEQNHKTNLS